MEHAQSQLRPLDALYLQRAYELAARGIGNTLPNPPAGAVVVRGGRIVGEGYHHRAGESHAESNALREAAGQARGATVYVSLEPCRHVGRTAPCTEALVEAGVARVVAGTHDPTAHGGGAAELRQRGIEVVVAEDTHARDLIEMFSRIMVSERPYVALKMAMSLDGMVASRPGVQERLGSDVEQHYVRELRTTYDAVMVGAGTVRIDDPQLTVRPPHDRLRGYVRVVVCERDILSAGSRIFAREEGYAKTIVLVPTAQLARFEELDGIADVVGVGASDSPTLDLSDAMKTLRAHGILSVLCEGGPRLAASLLKNALIDRLYWAVTPHFLSGDRAVPVLSGADLAGVRLRFAGLDRLGPDILISGVPVV